jgi:hypothetical protein
MTLTTTLTSPFDLYEAKISLARKLFVNSPALSVILAPDVAPKVLEAFLIYFNSLGVAMTEPVDDWITRAGVASKNQGFMQIGQALCSHAQHEAGHHLMMIKDTKILVNHWNSQYEPKLDAKKLLAHPITNGVRNYAKLHEDVITSDTPFCQIAIELEIEGLSVSVGPSLIEHCKKILGNEVIEGLSFLEEHIAIDVSHTHFNEKQLSKFLAEHPEQLESLIAAGEKALKAYSEFVNDCFELAKKLGK